MKTLPILMYHHVSPAPGLVTVSPQVFRQHIEWLARNGWSTLGAKEIEDFYAGREIPKKSVVITFDDGYLDNFVYAHPVLAEFDCRAMLFVATAWLGDGSIRHGKPDCPDHSECKRRLREGNGDSVMLRWSEVEAMRLTGTFEFHSHTHTHTRWDKELPPGEGRIAALTEDLARSRETLVARLGTASQHLCWPQGYFDPAYVKAATESGFRYLYTTVKRPNLSTDNPQYIGRIVTKERSAGWLGRRMMIYGSSVLGRLYLKLRGDADEYRLS